MSGNQERNKGWLSKILSGKKSKETEITPEQEILNILQSHIPILKASPFERILSEEDLEKISGIKIARVVLKIDQENTLFFNIHKKPDKVSNGDKQFVFNLNPQNQLHQIDEINIWRTNSGEPNLEWRPAQFLDRKDHRTLQKFVGILEQIQQYIPTTIST